jgi:ABC-type sugar transport system ATPase subunit
VYREKTIFLIDKGRQAMVNFLNVTNIHRRENGVDVVKGISFSQKPFEKLAIAGQSGSGKSTLLKIIAGLIQPEQGDVRFGSARVQGPDEQLIPGHPRIAYLSQQYELRNSYRVEEILRYANEQSEAAATRLYNVCRINHLLKRKTDQLSGGEKQRIALARLLSTMPRLLLLDEPFSNLDPPHRETLKSVIQDTGDLLGISCILVSHEPQDTLSWADRILVLREGQVVQAGPPQEIYRQPADPYVAGLFGRYNLIDIKTAAALGIAPLKDEKKKRLFVRPEQIQIHKGTVKNTTSIPDHLRVKTESVTFVGSAYEVDVIYAGQRFSARSAEEGIAIGDVLDMSIPRPGNWFIH